MKHHFFHFSVNTTLWCVQNQSDLVCIFVLWCVQVHVGLMWLSYYGVGCSKSVRSGMGVSLSWCDMFTVEWARCVYVYIRANRGCAYVFILMYDAFTAHMVQHLCFSPCAFTADQGWYECRDGNKTAITIIMILYYIYIMMMITISISLFLWLQGTFCLHCQLHDDVSLKCNLKLKITIRFLQFSLRTKKI